MTVYDYEVIGDAPVPAEWIAKRKNKLVRVKLTPFQKYCVKSVSFQMAEKTQLKSFTCDTLPILTNVSEGLLRTHKSQTTGKKVHRQVRN